MYHIGVVGGRDYSDYNQLKQVLNDRIEIIKGENIIDLEIIIVSGGAKGADSLAEKYAKKHDLQIVIFNPDWSLGPKAGPLRNKKIVELSDEIIAFWDGNSKGTKSSIKISKNAKKKCMIINY